MGNRGKLFVGFLILIVALWLIGQIFAATIGYVILAAVAFTIISLAVALIRASVRTRTDPKSVLHDSAGKSDTLTLGRLSRVKSKP